MRSLCNTSSLSARLDDALEHRVDARRDHLELLGVERLLVEQRREHRKDVARDPRRRLRRPPRGADAERGSWRVDESRIDPPGPIRENERERERTRENEKENERERERTRENERE